MRRFHAYCVGAAKTGTRSLALMLAQHYRSQHEPAAASIIDRLMCLDDGPSDAAYVRQFLKRRDELLNLEFESSHPLSYFVEWLIDLFPRAVFVLSVRDCFSWLDSIVNQHYTMMVRDRPNVNPFFRLLTAQYKTHHFCHPTSEQPLRDLGVPPLASYFTYWSQHNRKMMQVIPGERLLLMPTNEISDGAPRLAEFLGIPVETLDLSVSHSHRRLFKPINLIELVGVEHIERLATDICGGVMEDIFPYIRGISSLNELRSHGKVSS